MRAGRNSRNRLRTCAGPSAGSASAVSGSVSPTVKRVDSGPRGEASPMPAAMLSYRLRSAVLYIPSWERIVDNCESAP
eukprot:6205296-Pleurochrysis_carterae.AAC.5